MTYTLSYCESCIQMTNHIGDKCQKCNTKYIKLEDVQKQIQEICSCWNPIIEKELLEKINSLPTISPESMIKEMIEKDSHIINNGDDIYVNGRRDGLRELLQKFKS